MLRAAPKAIPFIATWESETRNIDKLGCSLGPLRIKVSLCLVPWSGILGEEALCGWNKPQWSKYFQKDYFGVIVVQIPHVETESPHSIGTWTLPRSDYGDRTKGQLTSLRSPPHEFKRCERFQCSKLKGSTKMYGKKIQIYTYICIFVYLLPPPLRHATVHTLTIYP